MSSKKQIRFVTSFSADGFHQYARNMLESVKTNWNPDELMLTAYYHDFPEELVAELPKAPNIEYRNLNLLPNMLAYRERMENHNGIVNGIYNWRMDAVKWCHKVYALSDYALELSEKEADAGWLCWLDADTVTTSPLTRAKMLDILDSKAEIAHLGRTDVDYSETSFIGLNLSFATPIYLIADLRGCYDIGEVTSYREWHDGFIFERLLKIYIAHGMNVQNLTPNVKGLAAFKESALSQYMIHFKGALKTESKLLPEGVAPDVKLPRYNQLASIVRTYAHLNVEGFEPKIVEVGTWNGGRAIEMALATFEKADVVHYVGYDLFEDATQDSDKEELNTKRHNTLTAVEDRLTQFASKMAEKNKTFIFKLFKGDSKETIPQTKWATDGASFVYIDGGHSEKTVCSDYENLKDAPVIVFDDYFTKDIEDKIPADEYLGTNRLVESLKVVHKCVVLPSTDKVFGGGITHICVLVNKKDLPPLPEGLMRIPIIVRPKDCVPKEYIISNINENMKIIPKWDFVNTCKPNAEHAIIVSAGPSIDYGKLKYLIKRTKGRVIAVKHSYPLLLKAGIIPYACVVLDPRPVTGVSTHGIVRETLFDNINRDTKFLIASMTDPSVTKCIMSKTSNVYGWHAFSEAVRKSSLTNKFEVEGAANIPSNATFVTGGTCAAMRAIGMFHILGFRQFHLVGFDCSIPELTPQQQAERLDEKPKYLRVETAGFKFWTTGELLAMGQDCEKLFNDKNFDMNIKHYGTNSLVAKVYEGSYHSQNKDYKEYLPNE